MAFTPDGIRCYPEQDEEQELKLLLLNFFARVCTPNPQLEAADAPLLNVTTLDEFSDWQDKHEDALIEPISFPAPNTDHGLTGEAL